MYYETWTYTIVTLESYSSFAIFPLQDLSTIIYPTISPFVSGSCEVSSWVEYVLYLLDQDLTNHNLSLDSIVDMLPVRNLILCIHLHSHYHVIQIWSWIAMLLINIEDHVLVLLIMKMFIHNRPWILAVLFGGGTFLLNFPAISVSFFAISFM